MARFDPILLDLDGTLVDAFITIHRAYCDTLPRFGHPAPTMAEVRRAVGGGLEKAMRHFLPEAHVADAVKVHEQYTNSILLEDVTLMPGALELIRSQHAAGAALAVFTNKRGEHSRQICAHLGITRYLDGIFGAKDTPWLKPQAEFSAHVLARLGKSAERAILIGDSPFDVQSARDGGFVCWCVTTGTHDAGQLREAGADGVFPDLFAVQRALAAEGS